MVSLALLSSLGCGPGRVGNADSIGDESNEPSESSDDEPSSSDDDEDPPNPTDSSGSDEGDSSEEDEGGSFVPMWDLGGCFYLSMCDPFAQDCSEGEKCVTNGDQACAGNKCVPVSGDQAPGEPCILDPIFDHDDCDATSVCWEGVCRAFCEGTGDAPECPEGYFCDIDLDGSLTICLPNDIPPGE